MWSYYETTVDESTGPEQTESVLQSKHIYKVGGGGGPVLGPLVSRLPLWAMYPSYVDVTQSKYHDHTADHLYVYATTTPTASIDNTTHHQP